MKITKKKIHGKEGRKIMMEGIEEMTRVVGSTLGAKGRNVILDKDYGSPLVVNDGITVCREIFFDDPLKNMGSQLLKDASARTNELAGDGTTATVVLAGSIISHGWDAVEKGANPVQLRRELETARDVVEKALKKGANEITAREQAIQIASISVQDKELGEKIGGLMYDIGVNGAVSIKPSIDRGVFIDKESGMRLEGQLVGGVVENPDKWESKLSKPRILILRDSPEDNEFESKWVPLLRQFSEGHRDAQGNLQVTKVNVPTLLIIAERLSRRLIMTLNENKAIINWCWFRPTTADKNIKEVYKDLASMIGGKIVNEEEGVFLSTYKWDELGTAEGARVTRHELVVTVSDDQLVNGEFLKRIAVVNGQIKNAEDEVEKKQIRDRLANLTGGVATIKVASATEQDTTELQLRIEDAINATRSAMEEGYVSGGGVALREASEGLKGLEDNGSQVLLKACEAPIRQILGNAGLESTMDAMLKNLVKGQGVDVMTEEIVDMKAQGVVDPLKVIRLALIHAVSVAGLLLTSEYAVTNEREDYESVKKFFSGK